MHPRRTENRSRHDFYVPSRALAFPRAIRCIMHLAAPVALLLLCEWIVPKADLVAAATDPPQAAPENELPSTGRSSSAAASVERSPTTQSHASAANSDANHSAGAPQQIAPADPTTAKTKKTERSAAGGLYWLARHQMKDGNWSLQGYPQFCMGRPCTDIGEEESLSAATGAALLPFLTAGQTQSSRGPFQKTVAHAVTWLLLHQRADGDLSADSRGKHSWMYAHALATIALCECYGMSRDKVVGRAAQKAVNFIQKAQSATGGWKYLPTCGRDPVRDRHQHFEYPNIPGDDGDLSVVPWQLMALKSAQMARLSVDPAVLERAKLWLPSVAIPGTVSDVFTYGRFSYRPGGAPSLTASAMGLWCKQSLHARRDDSAIVGGVQYLMKHLPDADAPNIVYWYFANQVMFNLNDRNWDLWNRKMRGTLVATQIRDRCAAGSWDADKPSGDLWGAQGGRVMTTSFATLILVTRHGPWTLNTSPTF
jgi:hypothetical protein